MDTIAPADTILTRLPAAPGSPTLGNQLRNLHVREVLYPEASGRDARCPRMHDVFLEVMRQIFPFAAVHLPFVVHHMDKPS